MRRALALALALAALPAEATEWTAERKGARETFHVQDLTLTLASREVEDGQAAPVITVRAKGLPPFSVRGQEGFSPASAQFQVAHFDPAAAGAQVLFASFTGGAHCCSEFVLIERLGGRWKALKLGLWDGDGLVRPEKDVDGDGIIDIAFADNSFLYAFDGYAGSFPPPLFLNVIAGKAVNVSREPRYRKLFESDMEDAKKLCADHGNGGCAGYVADAARAGRFDEAWKFMLAHYTPDRDLMWPTFCRKRGETPPCKSGEAEFKDYPQALHRFLEDRGYIERGKR